MDCCIDAALSPEEKDGEKWKERENSNDHLSHPDKIVPDFYPSSFCIRFERNP